ncbi:MAG: N-acyl homoserine lactonase family protein [Paenibacillaceae bacterium]
MAVYSIWLLEYAHVPTQPISSVLAGQHNKGTRELTFTYIALKGEGHNILIDVGTNNADSYTQQLLIRDDVVDWQPPDKVLAKIELTPEDIDTIFITHAHYDHIDNLDAFPNAHFYLQSKELTGWMWAMSLDRKFGSMMLALNPGNIINAMNKVKDGRMTLVEGESANILPGIHLHPEYDGHTFAAQAIIIDNTVNDVVERWIAAGDLAYVRENITGIGNDGVYVPLGLGFGSQLNMMRSIDKIIELANGNIDNIIVGHEIDNWKRYPSWKTSDGLHVAELYLAPGELSHRPV